VQRMNAACHDAGLRPPRFEEIGTRFRVTVYMERSEKPQLDPIDTAILKSLVAGKGLSTREIAAAIERTPRATRTRLQSLVDRGLVREIGTSPQDPKRRYFGVS
jgi:ATP-dependent DNA helicase RecG